MKIREVIPKSPVDHTETEIILADLLKKDRSFLHAHPEHRLTENQTLQFINQVKRREKNEPLAYILGYKEFFGLRFLVDRHVMIPRHDTEELVESVLEYVKGKNKPQIKIVDIGTGSGCISITLAKKLPKAKIYAVDVDQKSLVVARKNATRLKVYEKITFLKGALLSSLPGPVDVIVANLPYIKTGQINFYVDGKVSIDLPIKKILDLALRSLSAILSITREGQVDEEKLEEKSEKKMN